MACPPGTLPPDKDQHMNDSAAAEKVDAAPDSAVTRPLASLDPDEFMPRLVALLSNKLVWRESRLLRKHFDLGTNDWRVISALAVKPGATLTEVAEFIAVNKAIISKSVTNLLRRELLVGSDAPGRSRPLYLTEAGAELHGRMLPYSKSGEDFVLAHLDEEDAGHLNTILRHLLARTEDPEFQDPPPVTTA